MPQWADAPDFFAAFGWVSLDAGDLEADDLLGSLARRRDGRRRRDAAVHRRPRHVPVRRRARARALAPAKGGPELLGPDEVRARYGIEPAQVPDLIALRGDPSDGIPGAKGIGAKGAAELLRRHGNLEGVLAAAQSPTSDMTPRTRAALTGDPDLLHAFRDMATLRTIELKRPEGRAARPRGGAARGPAGRGSPSGCRHSARAARRAAAATA